MVSPIRHERIIINLKSSEVILGYRVCFCNYLCKLFLVVRRRSSYFYQCMHPVNIFHHPCCKYWGPFDLHHFIQIKYGPFCVSDTKRTCRIKLFIILDAKTTLSIDAFVRGHFLIWRYFLPLSYILSSTYLHIIFQLLQGKKVVDNHKLLLTCMAL